MSHQHASKLGPHWLALLQGVMWRDTLHGTAEKGGVINMT